MTGALEESDHSVADNVALQNTIRHWMMVQTLAYC